MFFDPTYILVIIGAVICMVASGNVNSTYNKYSRVQSSAGMTGAMAATRLLNYVGIYDVRVEHISGNLTDHYDPSSKVLRLSDSVYNATSVAAIGVAAHECGHAIQHAKGYVPLQIRTAIVPVVNIGSTLSWPMIILGVILGWNRTLIQIGILLFTAVVVFQLVTLPVEFNASSRALTLLEESGILYHEEMKQSRKVLTAAALTYVAAAASSILQLLRLLLLFGRRDD
ncbi:putative metal-dependent peptidase [Lachnospiraceae bacterium TWA4]|nr:putative metal-dependent peptidase [Lachnospiraceae bacterium TWA4]